jgi:signal transduction histidine kinase
VSEHHVEEIARLREALEAVTEQRDELDARLREVLYIVSHDLRAPLRHVKNLAEWAIEDAGDNLSEEARGHLDLINGRMRKLDAMLVGMLELSRVGRMDGPIEEVALSALLDELLADDLLPDGFTLERRGEMPTMRTSRLRLEQMLHHVIENAGLHHDRAEGRVVLSVTPADDGWRIEIRDDGPGLSEKQRARALALFQTSSRPKPGHLGLGLTVAHRIAKINGGDLSLSSGDPDSAERGLTVRIDWRPGWPTPPSAHAA